MPMNWNINECKNLSAETKEIFFSGNWVYSPFQALCNWLYQTKFNYGDRKRDFISKDNIIILVEEHIDQIIESKLIVADNPEEYDEKIIKSMLREFIGLKVFAT